MKRSNEHEVLETVSVKPDGPPYSGAGLSETLDRALALMQTQLRFPPQIDGPFIATWEDALRDEQIEADDVVKATGRIVREEEDFPRLARFLRYCRTQRKWRIADWRRHVCDELDRIESDHPSLTRKDRQKILDGVLTRCKTDGGRELARKVFNA